VLLERRARGVGENVANWQHSYKSFQIRNLIHPRPPNCARAFCGVDSFVSTKARFLLCSPDYYEVDYVINPWMEGNIHKASHAAAASQWEGLRRLLEQGAESERIPPQPGLPDMVFTANAGVVIGRKCVLSRFLPRERPDSGIGLRQSLH
jgi:hypothetical protein